MPYVAASVDGLGLRPTGLSKARHARALSLVHVILSQVILTVTQRKFNIGVYFRLYLLNANGMKSQQRTLSFEPRLPSKQHLSIFRRSKQHFIYTEGPMNLFLCGGCRSKQHPPFVAGSPCSVMLSLADLQGPNRPHSRYRCCRPS